MLPCISQNYCLQLRSRKTKLPKWFKHVQTGFRHHVSSAYRAQAMCQFACLSIPFPVSTWAHDAWVKPNVLSGNMPPLPANIIFLGGGSRRNWAKAVPRKRQRAWINLGGKDYPNWNPSSGVSRFQFQVRISRLNSRGTNMHNH